MSPAQAVLASWSFPPWVTALNLLAVLLYVRGWLALRDLLPAHLPAWRMRCFIAGVVALEIALASPIDAFDAFSLTDHMVQHLILMLVVPPLLLLGNPMLPLLRGLPRRFTRRVLGPILRWPPVAGLGRMLTHPGVCFAAFTLAMFVWHAPGLYDLALRSEAWHDWEHVSFLFGSILFWWPVVQPWPGRSRWPRWAMPVYLMAAMAVGGVVSAFLIFSGRVIYPAYLFMPRLGGISALDDQILAGIAMWASGSLAYMIPAIYFVVTLLSPAPAGGSATARRAPNRPVAAGASRFLAVLAWVLPLAVLIAAYLVPASIDTDGNIVRAQGAAGAYHVSVLTPPDPLTAGPLEVSVLVQNQQCGAVLDRPVSLGLAPAGGQASTWTQATVAASSLKLFQAGRLDLPGPGVWRLQVALDGVNSPPIDGVVRVGPDVH